MAKNRIVSRKDFCMGCRNCETACSYANTKTFNPRRARIQIINDEFNGIDNPNVCRQCKNPKCVEACPEGAFELNDAGVYSVNREVCTGCGLCEEACPFNAIHMDPVENVALKCDLCNGSPQCILMCRKLPHVEHKGISFEKDLTVKVMPGILDSGTEWGTINVNDFVGEDLDELFVEVAKQYPDLKGVLQDENGLASDELTILINDVPVKSSHRGLKTGDEITVLMPLDGG